MTFKFILTQLIETLPCADNKKGQKAFQDISANFGRTAKLKIPKYTPMSKVFFGKMFEVVQLL
jgi:hypothetical protein